ncbi:M14 family metallopeptidase [Pseudoalteromonas sp. Cnat2-41]|uniref:M14 family metallopeptidase n=1 Tax=unclassified Pseudoalteromonas TaxID=194690 RepID=UPI001EF96267|nr:MULTISPECIES: M14 family metallopeptidase [unclassified Pseudoalteromonas]MCF2861644.1 M14 family metallopeptidase [Pseudoalteromonas sp. CNAT2-18]MCG7557318.1 M14 family metallopeptidase [Pseudoalteromonas sp. CNAT2-18.1]
MFTSLLLATALAADAHLPKLIPWQGQSEALMQQQGVLTTAFEHSGGMISPDYQATMAYLKRLQQANPTQFSLVKIGQSDAGRDINMLVASEQGNNSAAHIANSDKPTLLIQAGIHSGEIDGKDAGFMLLRDIATGKRLDILKSVNLLFIPILNVDGHERASAYNRINQRGPAVMGFRTNGQNLNLNRDFTKLDTPGVRALAEVVNQYQPSLYLDIHVTDGADYQYDITYGYAPTFASATPKVTAAMDQWIAPVIDQKLEEMGHIPGPLVFVMDKMDFAKGLAGWVAGPRYSNGWGELRHLPTILVENHSLKPYKQRVLGTYVLIDGAITALTRHGDDINAAVAQSKAQQQERLVVERSYAKEPDTIAFKGIAYDYYESTATGAKEVRYLGKPKHYDALPIFWQKEIKTEVDVPKAFYIPRQYTDVIATLKMQGVEIKPVTADIELPLAQARIVNHQFAQAPFEGRFRVSAEFDYSTAKTTVNQQWLKVSTTQPLGLLATHMLHPEAPDSLFQWGFFHSIFQRTEYVENYALAPYAQQMLESNPDIAERYHAKLEDEDFANDSDARRAWLYAQTPYYDQHYLHYPILMQF